MSTKTKSRTKTILKITGISLLSLIGVVVIGLGSYIGYCGAQYYRIPDNQELDVSCSTDKLVKTNQELTFTTLNAGFGAYSDDFSFFMDTGIKADGTPSVGKMSRAKSKDDVINNINGLITSLKTLDSDFVSLQEVDTKGDRSRKVNEAQMFSDAFIGLDQVFANNYHSAYFIYPVNKPIGAAKSGLQFLSKYHINNSLRKSYKVTDDFFDKMFDLDRCFSIQTLDIENDDHDLILINSHMSAYDEGGLIRNEQIKQLNQVIVEEEEKGNYVIVGGDFNHDLLVNNPYYGDKYNIVDKIPFKDQFNDRIPDWYCSLYDENHKSGFDERFTIITSEDNPTFRNCDDTYLYGRTYVGSIDGFITSSNVEILSCTTMKTGDDSAEMFAFSDHQPVTLKFKLN